MIRATIGNRTLMEMKPIRVTIWNEYVHERTDPKVGNIYPNGIHNAIAEGIKHHAVYHPNGYIGSTRTRFVRTDIE